MSCVDMEGLTPVWLEGRRRLKMLDREEMEDMDVSLRGLPRGAGGGAAAGGGGGRPSVKRDCLVGIVVVVIVGWLVGYNETDGVSFWKRLKIEVEVEM